MSDILSVKSALISVSDKQGLVDFAHKLVQNGVRIISTGGTAQALEKAGIPFVLVKDITGYPEMMEGRVKTLHPKIHGAILGKRNEHEEDAARHDIQWIDLVVVNLYPFQAAVQSGAGFSDVVEQIDVGGPAMLRAAAKNHLWVGAVYDTEDYDLILQEITQHGGLSITTRKQLAAKTFAHTAAYDAAIAQYLLTDTPLIEQKECVFALRRLEHLRYGENPHQAAAVYASSWGGGLTNAKILQGKALSYNNLVDAEAALQCAHAFSQPATVIVKHANPCGAAIAEDISTAYTRAFAADNQSAFGGVVALNRPCTKEIAEAMSSVFMELIIAPAFEEDALTIFAKKANLRVIEIPNWDNIANPWVFRSISGGMVIQEQDTLALERSTLKCVTQIAPDEAQLDQLLFAWILAKFLKSNAIAICKNGRSVGLCGGQVSRIAALESALARGEGHLSAAVLASDGFFPFRDSIDALKNTGIKAIIQPGGSIRDEEVINACNEAGIAMVFTGIRCFNH